ncbi:hypothetical protein D917_10489 [Trichinella nativa]|uniref:Uncharacterized protein n=1 Tax=Trichinella nativa TaxID=6335 RepID=A0A1Y3EAM9_9BILA|nr:hypothetical protein D917_10489 [Trichinella nativa]
MFQQRRLQNHRPQPHPKRKIEQKTGRIRDEIAVMSAIQIFISLFASTGAELLVELLCLAYPAVKILTGLESIEKPNYLKEMAIKNPKPLLRVLKKQ